MRDNSLEALRSAFPDSAIIAEKNIDSWDDDYWIVANLSYRDFTPRTIPGLKKETVDKALRSLTDRVFKYVHSKDKTEYETWHRDSCKAFCSEFEEQSGKSIKYGKAQKIVNMTMKYLLCMQGAERYRARFKDCHMPLDTYTLAWFCDTVVHLYNEGKKKADRISRSKIMEISWSNLECGSPEEQYSYLWMQKLIRKYLESDANKKYRNENEEPLTALEAEFYIWPEQKFIQACKGLTDKKVYPAYADEGLKEICIDLVKTIQAFIEKA